MMTIFLALDGRYITISGFDHGDFSHITIPGFVCHSSGSLLAKRFPETFTMTHAINGADAADFDRTVGLLKTYLAGLTSVCRKAVGRVTG